MIHDFNKILNYPIVSDFLNKGLEILHHKEFPISSYFGVNYDKNGLKNVKFYISTLKKIDIEQLKVFFPINQNLIDAYEEYCEGLEININNMGTMFAVKVAKDGSYNYTFYARVKKNENLSFKHLSLPFEEQKILDDAFVIAMNSDSEIICEKKYFGVFNSQNVNYMLDYFGCSIEKSKVRFVEYVEYQNHQKMAIGVKDVSYLQNYLEETNGEDFIELNNYVKSKFGVIPFSPVVYLNSSEKAMYFIENTCQKDNELNVFHSSLILFRLRDYLNTNRQN
jgi:hypothetical protein